jgi:hypothetical protein
VPGRSPTRHWPVPRNSRPPVSAPPPLVAHWPLDLHPCLSIPFEVMTPSHGHPHAASAAHPTTPRPPVGFRHRAPARWLPPQPRTTPRLDKVQLDKPSRLMRSPTKHYVATPSRLVCHVLHAVGGHHGIDYTRAPFTAATPPPPAPICLLGVCAYLRPSSAPCPHCHHHLPSPIWLPPWSPIFPLQRPPCTARLTAPCPPHTGHPHTSFGELWC